MYKPGKGNTKNDKPLKLVNQFTYLGSHISSTKSDVSIRKSNAWITIDSLTTRRKFNFSDKIKREFFQAVVVSITVWLHHLDFNKTIGEKARWELQKDDVCSFELILAAVPDKTAAVRLPASHFKNHPSKTSKTWWVLLEKHGQTHK